MRPLLPLPALKLDAVLAAMPMFPVARRAAIRNKPCFVCINLPRCRVARCARRVVKCGQMSRDEDRLNRCIVIRPVLLTFLPPQRWWSASTG